MTEMKNLLWIDGRAFADYRQWECWQNGMYKSRVDKAVVGRSIGLLGDSRAFGEACLSVCSDWPVSVAVHVSDSGRNRRAYFGRAACSVRFGATESETRVAWWCVDEERRREANSVANSFIQRLEQRWKSENFPTQNGQLELMFMKRPSNE